MSEVNSSDLNAVRKPSKPYPDFPLFPHTAGVWAKKIRGKVHYFGKWADPDEALRRYLERKDDLHAGRTSQADQDAKTVKDVCNAFLNAKLALVNAGELSRRTWDDYKRACDLLVKHFGRTRRVADIAPDDLGALRKRMTEQWGPHMVSKMIQCVRCALKFALDNGLVGQAVRYGQGFKRPTKKVMRLYRAAQGPKLFTAHEVRRLIEAASVQVKAMILLAINAAFGNSDIGNLPLSAVDLDAGIIDFAHPKTGIPRRCILWGETTEAIRQAISERPEPKDPADANLVFVTKYGASWARGQATVTHELAKLLRKLKINGRKGLGFYTLRHVFRTVADEAKDQSATDYVMGREVAHMSTVYREGISDARLKAISEYVRRWVYPAESEEPTVIPMAAV
jgi:integrase